MKKSKGQGKGQGQNHPTSYDDITPGSSQGASSAQNSKSKSANAFKERVEYVNATPSTSDWRVTDAKFHELVREDKKNFFEKGIRRVVRTGHDIPSSTGVVGIVVSAPALIPVPVAVVPVQPVTIPLPVMVTEEVLVTTVGVSRSAPGVLATELPIHAPFDYNSLAEEPPVDYSTFIQCPYCGRRFERLAAARHIPQCKDYYHNQEEKERFQRSKPKNQSS